jgi:tRNA pseudouridine55 synthase
VTDAAACGVLVVDKPAGPTSFDVVSRVRRLLRAERAGHTGTLDPAATGVLAVCVGEAVKLQQFLAGGDKEYEATVVFGVATATGDAEGEVLARADASGLRAESLRGALPRFLGLIEQVPPMFSAVRVGGRRLHEAARAGQEVERQPRRVAVHALELLDFSGQGPGVTTARLAIRCGKGTYVRVLATDLGRALGLPAHLGALRRTAAGPFRIAEALPLLEAERLASADRAALRARLVGMADALRDAPAIRLSPEEVRDVGHGRALARGEAAGVVRALDGDGRLVAVCEARGGALRPVRVMSWGRCGPRPRQPNH